MGKVMSEIITTEEFEKYLRHEARKNNGESLADSTIRTYINDSERFAEHIKKNIYSLEYDEIKNYHDETKRGKSLFEESRNTCSASLKHLLKFKQLRHNDSDFMDSQEINHSELSAEEKKSLKQHLSYEGRISPSQVKAFKNELGYNCEVCNLNFENIYGELGKNFIELHHLVPFKDLKPDEPRTLTKKHFAVLCANCHRMIHKMKDPSDTDGLKKLLKKEK